MRRALWLLVVHAGCLIPGSGDPTYVVENRACVEVEGLYTSLDDDGVNWLPGGLSPGGRAGIYIPADWMGAVIYYRDPETGKQVQDPAPFPMDGLIVIDQLPECEPEPAPGEPDPDDV